MRTCLHASIATADANCAEPQQHSGTMYLLSDTELNVWPIYHSWSIVALIFRGKGAVSLYTTKYSMLVKKLKLNWGSFWKLNWGWRSRFHIPEFPLTTFHFCLDTFTSPPTRDDVTKWLNEGHFSGPTLCRQAQPKIGMLSPLLGLISHFQKGTVPL